VTSTIALLVVAAFAAGLVDAIAGGGGIITVPALLAAGLDPRVALATNKGQAIFGSGASFAAFARHGHIDRDRAPWSFFAAGLGAFAGAKLVLWLDPAKLRPIVLGLLLFAAAASFVRKPVSEGEPPERSPAVAVAIALPIGMYDGFFGPGTGTFLLIAFAYVYGDDLVRASGNAKVANFASNVVAFATFAATGMIRWEIALPMGLAQLVGAIVGTRLAVKQGAGIVRLVAVTVSLALAIRVAWQMLA
jgi:hypothetical protein